MLSDDNGFTRAVKNTINDILTVSSILTLVESPTSRVQLTSSRMHLRVFFFVLAVITFSYALPLEGKPGCPTCSCNLLSTLWTWNLTILCQNNRKPIVNLVFSSDTALPVTELTRLCQTPRAEAALANLGSSWKAWSVVDSNGLEIVANYEDNGLDRMTLFSLFKNTDKTVDDEGVCKKFSDIFIRKTREKLNCDLA